jgi:ribosomal-protein-alanine N-acetyltransferase
LPCSLDRPPVNAVDAQHTVRPACAADAAALAAIDAASQVNPWSEDQFAALGSDAGSYTETALVSDRDGRVDGYVVFAQVLDEASVHRIAVDPMCRGRGLGQALLQEAMHHMQRSGASRCLLEVRRSNTVARRLYEANGFRLDGVRKDYYPSRGGREDALLMSRSL